MFHELYYGVEYMLSYGIERLYCSKVELDQYDKHSLSIPFIYPPILSRSSHTSRTSPWREWARCVDYVEQAQLYSSNGKLPIIQPQAQCQIPSLPAYIRRHIQIPRYMARTSRMSSAQIRSLYCLTGEPFRISTRPQEGVSSTVVTRAIAPFVQEEFGGFGNQEPVSG